MESTLAFWFANYTKIRSENSGLNKIHPKIVPNSLDLVYIGFFSKVNKLKVFGNIYGKFLVQRAMKRAVLGILVNIGGA